MNTTFGNISSTKQTVDSMHKTVLTNIKKTKKQNVANQKKIDQLQKELEEIELIPPKERSDQDYERIKEIKKLRRKLENEMSDELEHTYLFRAGKTLINYYNPESSIVNQNQKEDIMYISNNNTRNKTINKLKNVRNGRDNSTGQLSQFVTRTSTSNRGDTCDIYISNIDNNSFMIPYRKEIDEICSDCGIERLFNHSEAKLICPNCGSQISKLIDSDKPSYKDPPAENTYFAYKRLNHLKECLTQFQAKESTEIPQEVYDAIICETKKERKTDLSQLTDKQVRGYLKKHSNKGYNKYYEHVPHIINRLNHQPPITLTTKMEDDIINMFICVQEPFDKHANRNNFLSYHYFLHKACQLLGYDDKIVKAFPLLKSDERLLEQDVIWEKICNDLGYTFYSSFDDPKKKKSKAVYWNKILVNKPAETE